MTPTIDTVRAQVKDRASHQAGISVADEEICAIIDRMAKRIAALETRLAKLDRKGDEA